MSFLTELGTLLAAGLQTCRLYEAFVPASASGLEHTPVRQLTNLWHIHCCNEVYRSSDILQARGCPRAVWRVNACVRPI
jgi:hypothetical protein